MGVSRVTGEDSRGWWEPLSIITQLVRSRGVSEARAREWEQAADQVDRLVALPGWPEALAPGATDLHLGVRPVYRPAGRVDRRRTRATRPERRSADAKLGNARMDVPIEVPREWAALPAGQFRRLAVAAILDGLRYLGVAARVGPPALRPQPRPALDTAGLSAAEQVEAGQWAENAVAALTPGAALLAARRITAAGRTRKRTAFLGRLGDVAELSGPVSDRLAFWQATILPSEGADDAR